MDRTAQLLRFIQTRPDDPFPRYALAMEKKGQGDVPGAITALEELLARKADYVPAYLQLGNLLSQNGRVADARECLSRGQTHARAQGNAHALSELTSALEAL
ncbi:MAG: tetratricopeptide repeat protein [Deltaproteobacteria bacterium]|nr:tetratricopeptide repeat protein [Deltaproteobacteria bacterium]